MNFLGRISPWLVAARSGARIGALCGVASLLVDLCSAAFGAAKVDYADLVFAATSLLLPAMVLGGVLASLWLFSAWTWITSSGAKTSQSRLWLLAMVAALPLVAGMFWVPWSWLAENWDTLKSQHRTLAIAGYVGMFLFAVALARAAVWLYLRSRKEPDRQRWLYWLLILVSVVAGSVAYWADRNLFDDLYDDLHYGLAATFVLALTVSIVLLRQLGGLRRVSSEPTPTLSVREGAAWALALAACAVVQLSLGEVRERRALIYSKTMKSASLDLDGDGYTGIFRGADCAPLDGSRNPALVDMPGNGIDEDCTGADARWPKPKPKAAYDVPDARNFNLLLISVDTLRADRLSAYGNERRTSKNIDRLAGEALLFEKAYAQSTKTFESIPSFMTGLYPANLARDYTHSRTRNKKAYLYTLTPETTVFSQVLKANGYTTRGIVSLGYLHTLGLDRGFDDFDVVKNVTRDARKFLGSAPDQFFLWLHYLEPHSPYVKHGKFDYGDAALDRYDSEIAYVDMLIGQVLEELRNRDLERNTVVVLTADHGEEFGEHGGEYHTNKLYEELLHVPLVIKVPGVAPQRIKDTVELLDIAPTLCEALRLSDCGELDGQSLWATLAGQRDTGFGFGGAYAETSMQQGVLKRRGLLLGGFRLVLDIRDETPELYDVRNDPKEQRDIARTHPEEVARLREELAIRPYRRLGQAFQNAPSDSNTLAKALPRIRAPSLLRNAVEAIEKNPSSGAQEAIARTKKRPPFVALKPR